MNSCGGATNVRPYGRTDIRSCQRCAIPVRPPEPRSPRLEPHLYRICGGLLPLKSELGSPNPVQVRSIPRPGPAGDTRPNPIGVRRRPGLAFPGHPGRHWFILGPALTVTGDVTAGPVPVGHRPMRNSRLTPRGGFFRRPGATWSSGGRICSGGGGKRRPPAHAGRLTRWERVAFAVVFILMLLYILAVTISAIRSGYGAAPPRGSGGGDHSLAVTRIQHATRG